MFRKLCLLTMVLLPALAAATDVPVANGGFEQGLEGWSLYKPTGFSHGEATVVTGEAHSGKQAVRILNVTGGGKTLVGLTPAKSILLPDDCRTFALTAWMKINVDPQMVELRVASTDAKGQALTPWQQHGWRFFRPPLDPHRGQWHQLRCEFGAQPDWGGFQLTFWVNGAGADVLIDDLAVETMDGRQWRVPAVGGRLPDPAPGVPLWWESPQVKVYPNEPPPTRTAAGLQLAAAGGEYECVQLCLRPQRELAGVRVSFSDLQGPGRLPASSLSANFVGLVEVAAALTGRSVLGPTPDPLLTDATRTLPAGQTSALWLTLKVPRGTPAGTYKGTVALQAQGLSATVPLRVRVFGFDLPETPSLRTIGRIWQSHPGYEAEFHRNLQEHRCAGSGRISGLKISRAPGAARLTVDTSGLHQGVQDSLKRYGCTLYNVPAVYLGDASGFYAKDKKWQGFDLLGAEFDVAFGDYCKQVGDALRAEGVLQYAMWQIWDEPQNDEMVQTCMHLAKLIRQNVPEARVYLTTGVKPELADLVGIWCLPWPETYNSRQAAEARGKGAELWAYDNSLYSLDVPDSSLLLRHYLWTLRRYDIVGAEWWAISQWKSDPWAVPNQYAPQNGGGFFLYPTPDRKGAPVNSLRWELYREGVEDYDVLTMLAQEQDRAVQALGVSDARLGGEAQMKELVGTVAPGLGEVKREALAAPQAKEEAAARIELLRAAPAGVVGVTRESGRRVLLIAPGRCQVTVNGKTVQPAKQGQLLAVRFAGLPLTVKLTQGAQSKSLTLRP